MRTDTARHVKPAHEMHRSAAVLGVVGLVFSVWLLATTVRDVEPVGASAEADPALVTSGPGGSDDTGSSTTSEQSSSTAAADGSGVGVPPADLPREGPGITQPGILLVVSPSRGGSFDVWERVRLPDPVDTVTLSPPDVTRAGTAFAGAEAVVTKVQLDVDGQPIHVPDGVVVDGTFDVPVEGITTFELSYELDGTSVRSLPSTARRALAAISPLLDDTPYNLPVSVVVDGPVLGVGCPLLDLSDRACAQGTSQRILVARSLPFDDAVVTVQFDLPGE